MCTDEDIGWWCDRLSGEHAGSGFRVETKSGMGRTYHKDEPIFGKVPVYLDDGQESVGRPGKHSNKGIY
jgi:hypothetical protein